VVRSFTKGEATEAAISTAAGKHRYLHFATHGFFDDPKPTGQAISADDRSGAARGRRTSPNPALLCGLVCAGANRPTADDDGVLTALEIADLDLGGVELAVLSACETGLGEVAGGDGVLGLQRAFQLAGARTTVTSLWQVPDEATESLMTRFYENRLKQGMPALKALREAQLWLLNEGVEAGVLKEPLRNGRRTPPLFWAAFVLAGDWR
jgi:CHAT domain-containing protein